MNGEFLPGGARGVSPRGVIIGAGMAAARLAEELDARAPGLDVTVFAAESRNPYNRVLLSTVLAGTTKPAQLALPIPESVTVRQGVTVIGIDRAARQVVADDGTRTPYDTLVIATGSEPVLPPIPGIEHALPFRTLDDCERILGRSAYARDAVVIGGGLLGIEAGRGLAGRGLAVTIVDLAGHLMESQLDAEAGHVLGGTLAGLGISVRTGVSAAAIKHDGVELTDGTWLPSDLVIASCGVRPVAGLAHEAGLDVERGIVVDDQLRTSDPDIFAIGECAQHDDVVYGLVAPCWDQAAVAASVIAGEPAIYRGSRLVTRLKARGIELASLGSVHGDGEVIRFSHPDRGVYRKLVINGDRLTGAIIVGESAAIGTLTQHYDRGTPLPQTRESLIFPELLERGRETRRDDMVCECAGVTKNTVRDAVQRDAATATPTGLRAATGAGSGCGTCLETIRDLLSEIKSEALEEREIS